MRPPEQSNTRTQQRSCIKAHVRIFPSVEGHDEIALVFEQRKNAEVFTVPSVSQVPPRIICKHNSHHKPSTHKPGEVSKPISKKDRRQNGEYINHCRKGAHPAQTDKNQTKRNDTRTKEEGLEQEDNEGNGHRRSSRAESGHQKRHSDSEPVSESEKHLTNPPLLRSAAEPK